MKPLMMNLFKKPKYLIFALVFLFAVHVRAAYILIPMDESQSNHLKAYGIATGH